MGEFSLCCVAVFILKESPPLWTARLFILSACLALSQEVHDPHWLTIEAPMCTDTHSDTHTDTHFLCLSLTLICVVALVTISYIFPGYHILLSAAQHTGVCNETSDEQCTHRHTNRSRSQVHCVPVSLYWLTDLSKEDEKSQTEWALSLLSVSRHHTDFFSPPYCCLCCHWRWYLQARSNPWV